MPFVKLKCRDHVAICLVLLILGCGSKAPEIAWVYTDADVTGEDRHIDEAGTIDIDIYLDATLSMVGYVNEKSSTYKRFLDDLEIAAAGGWRTANVQFFKFGTKIKAIDRDGFKAAKTSSFYQERGIFERTNIDSVINRTNNQRVSIVLTDLFQDDGDINSIVLQIKDQCFAKGIQTAILAVPSEFNGTVYDAKVAPYRYKTDVSEKNTYRPFYALMFGEVRNLQRMFEFLKTAEYVDEEYFLIISRYLVHHFEADVTKTRESRGLNMRRMPSTRTYPHHFGFALKKGETSGTLLADIRFQRAPHTPDFHDQSIELQVFRKSSFPGTRNATPDSIPTSDLKLTSLTRNNDSITATINLELKEAAGSYSYLAYLQLPKVGGFALPEWVDSFSSQNPSSSRDANKTLNLKKFVTDLTRANQSFSQPKIAKFYLTVLKR